MIPYPYYDLTWSIILSLTSTTSSRRTRRRYGNVHGYPYHAQPPWWDKTHDLQCSPITRLPVRFQILAIGNPYLGREGQVWDAIWEFNSAAHCSLVGLVLHTVCCYIGPGTFKSIKQRNAIALTTQCDVGNQRILNKADHCIVCTEWYCVNVNNGMASWWLHCQHHAPQVINGSDNGLFP